MQEGNRFRKYGELSNKIVANYRQSRELVILDTTCHIDTIKGINGEIFCGAAELYFDTLASMESNLNTCIKELGAAYDKEEYKNLNDISVRMMENTVSMAISGLYYPFYFMTELYAFGMYPQMNDFYPTLVEAYIEYKIESRKTLKMSQGEVYELDADHQKCEHSGVYRLEIDPVTKIVYCLKQG